jgi:hypothetical protein
LRPINTSIERLVKLRAIHAAIVSQNVRPDNGLGAAYFAVSNQAA